MADRTSAEIFSKVLVLAEKYWSDYLIEDLYKLMERYDFLEQQLSDEAQEILISYGLWSRFKEEA